jgi:hypothetical protein
MVNELLILGSPSAYNDDILRSGLLVIQDALDVSFPRVWCKGLVGSFAIYPKSPLVDLTSIPLENPSSNKFDHSRLWIPSKVPHTPLAS